MENELFRMKGNILMQYTGNAECVEIPKNVWSIDSRAFRGKNIRELIADNANMEIGRILRRMTLDGKESGLEQVQKLTVKLSTFNITYGYHLVDLNEIAEALPSLRTVETIFQCKSGRPDWNTRRHPVLYFDQPLKRPLHLILDAGALNYLAYVDGPMNLNTLFCTSNLTVSLSDEDLTHYDSTAKKILCLSSLRYPKVLEHPEDGVNWLTKYGSSLFASLIQRRETQDLLILLNKPDFTGFSVQTYEKLIALADEKSLVEVKAALMDSFHRHHNLEKVQKQKERKMLNQIMDPFNAEIMSKTWSWGSNETGLTLKRYKAKKTPEATDIVIPERIGKKQVTALSENLFRDVSIRTVIFPDAIREIPDNLFTCAKFELPVSLPEMVRLIRNQAFMNAEIRELTLSSSLTGIGDSAFEGSCLTGITLPDTVKYIGLAAFRNCRRMEKASVSDSISRLPECSFTGCRKLSSVKLPGNCTALEARCFSMCESLKNLFLPETVKYIGRFAFEGSAIQYINLDLVSIVGAEAFRECKSLEAANLWNAVVIGKQAFASSGIRSVYAPLVCQIEGDAFQDCPRLTEAHISSAVYIASNAFMCSRALKRVFLSQNLMRVEKSAFQSILWSSLIRPLYVRPAQKRPEMACFLGFFAIVAVCIRPLLS